MQYILSEDEYKSLVKKSIVEELEKEVNDLNKLVLKISKFPCIHEDGGYGCCNMCPITSTCKLIKHYSK